MSEAVRSYTNSAGTTFRRRRKGSLRRLLLFVLVVIIAGGWWVVRDTHPLWSVIPAEHKAGIVLPDVNTQRTDLADAAFWPLLPAAWGLEDIPDQLRSDFGLPPWVLNNLIGDISYLYANDLESLSDPCFITRMSPFGTLMERLSRLARVTASDPAGGLNLREVPDAGLHYAVRGRLFIASPSREALIRALTLPAETTWSREEFRAAVEASRGVDLRVAVRFDDGDALAEYLERGEVSMRIQPRSIDIAARVMPSGEVATRLQPLRRTSNGDRPLIAPPPGMLEVAGNFGQRFDDTVTALADVAGLDTPNARTWAAWAEAEHGEGDLEGLPDFPRMIARLLGPAGPAFALSITDVDPGEVIPVPIIEAALEAGEVDPAAWFDALEPAVSEIDGWERVPQRDEERELVFCRTIGGDSLTPAVKRMGERLFVSTNLAHAQAAADAGGPIGPQLEQTGNLFVRVHPAACVDALDALAQQLVMVDGLRGHDAASWNALVDAWRGYLEPIQDATLLAALEADAIAARVRIEFEPAAPEPAPTGDPVTESVK